MISIGTFLTSVVLSIQGRRQYGRMPPLCVRYWFFTKINKWVWLEVPPQLEMLWEELDDHPTTVVKRTHQEKRRKIEEKRRKQQVFLRLVKLCKFNFPEIKDWSS